MILSYFREIKYNMKVLSQKAKCDQSDPGGHISENPTPYSTRQMETRTDDSDFVSTSW